MITRHELKQYGKVEIFEEVNDRFHVKITEGFNPNANNTFELMGKINAAVGDKYPLTEKLVTDTDMFDCILKK